MKEETGAIPQALKKLLEWDTGRGDEAYLDGHLRDSWGNEYLYTIEDGEPVVSSLGKDNELGGTGENEDIRYPEESVLKRLDLRSPQL